MPDKIYQYFTLDQKIIAMYVLLHRPYRVLELMKSIGYFLKW